MLLPDTLAQLLPTIATRIPTLGDKLVFQIKPVLSLAAGSGFEV